jgi:glycosyltransferase involved in cell wall biosynthesis
MIAGLKNSNMNKKIKVLECIRQGQIGGGESHLLSLVENLDRERFEPVVLSFTEGPMVDRLRDLGVRAHVIYTEKPFDITKWGKVKELLKAERPALIHAHGTRASSNTLWAARSLHIPLIYTVHGWSFHDDQNPLVRRLRIIGEKYITSRSAFNIAVSASNRQSGLERIPGLKATVISNGIDQEKFSPSRKLKDIRTELGIPMDAMLVLFVARFTNHKQPLVLISAFKEALEGLPSLHLLMVGDGDQKEEGKALVSKLGLEEKVTFQPFRQDVPDVLAAADIFVLPSLWEGLPIGLLEAMAMGRAVVATRVDGTREVVHHEGNGLLAEPGDLQGLAAALVRLGKDGELRTTLSMRALSTIKDEYNAAAMTRKIEAVYDSFVR